MDLEAEKDKYIRRLIANQAYLGRISNIFCSKLSCTPVFFWRNNGEEVPHKCIQILDTSCGAVTISEKDTIIKARLDGTNFSIRALYDNVEGKYAYKNDRLGIIYSFSERNIDDDITERILKRRIDDNVTTVRYYVLEDFIIVSDFISETYIDGQIVDDENKISVRNTDFDDLDDDDKIAEYIRQNVTEGIDTLNEDDLEELTSQGTEEYPDIPDPSASFEPDGEYDELRESEDGEVYYPGANENYKGQYYDLPQEIEDFNPEDYEKFMHNLSDAKVSESQVVQDSMEETQYCVYDSDSYSIHYHEETNDEQLREQIIDMIYEVVTRYNVEIIDLIDALAEIDDEFKNAIVMIRNHEYLRRLESQDQEDGLGDR